MLRPNFWLIVAAIFAGVLCCFFWREHREVVALRAELMSRDTAHSPIEKSPRAQPATRKNIESGGHEPTDAGAVGNSPPDQPRILSEIDRQIRARMLQYQRWTRLSKKAGLIAALNLLPEKLAEFKDLVVERDYAATDAKDAAGHVGINATEAAADAMSKVDERIKALLGDADYQKYLELVGADVVWGESMRGTLVGYFVDAGAPLTPEQTSALGRAFYLEIRARAQDGSGQVGTPDPVTGFNPSQKFILDQVSSALPPSQLETLRSFFLTDNQLGALMNVSPSNASPR